MASDIKILYADLMADANAIEAAVGSLLRRLGKSRVPRAFGRRCEILVRELIAVEKGRGRFGRLEAVQFLEAMLRQFRTYRNDLAHVHAAKIARMSEEARAEERWRMRIWKVGFEHLNVILLDEYARLPEAKKHGA